MTRRRLTITIWSATSAFALLVAAIAILASGSSPSSRAAGPAPAVAAPAQNAGGSPALGTRIDIRVPAALLTLPLVDQHGHHVELASWADKTVLLVPFLTLCQDVCPLTTGNLLQVQQSLAADHAAGHVQIVELSVDPGRDDVTRLAAYAKLTGASWELVTESPGVLAALHRFFGFYYHRVPEDTPPGTDWLTGRKLTYDVDHSDDYFVIDPSGVERVVNDAAPSFHGKLSPRLYAFLSSLGRQHLRSAPQPDWTPVDVLAALTVSVHRRLALRSAG